MEVEGVDGGFGCGFDIDFDEFSSGFSLWNGREIRDVHSRGVQHSRFPSIRSLTHGYSRTIGDDVACHRGFISSCSRKVRNIGRDVRHFAKKHKTALIITAAVVGVVVVTVLTAGTGTPAATAKATATIAVVAAAEAASAPRRREENESMSDTSAIGAQPINISPPSRPTVSEPLKPTTIAYTPTPNVPLNTPPLLTPPSASVQPISQPTASSSAFTLPKTMPVNVNQGPPSHTPWRREDAQLNHPHASALVTAPSMEGPKHVSQPSRSSAAVFTDPDSPVRAYDLPPREPAQSTPRVFEVLGRQLARGRIGGINGVGNSFENAQDHASYLSQLSGNVGIEWVHNRSHTIPVDIVESLANFIGISPPAKDLVANWVKFHEEHKNDPDAKYLQICHSQGAAHVKTGLLSAPQEIRDRIIVVAIAPAAIIPKNLCFDSFNYASRDFVPLLEASLRVGLDDNVPSLREQYLAEFKELIFLDPHPDADPFDHGLQSPTYRERLTHHIRVHEEEYDKLK